MATNDFLTWAGDPAADVMTQADYADAVFTARLIGYSTGTALSNQLNKTWRNASLITAMIGQFSVDQTGRDMLDDGTSAGMTALQNTFTLAVQNAAIAAIGTGYLPLTGGILTGGLVIQAAAGLDIVAPAGSPSSIALDAAAGQYTQIYARTNGILRWALSEADNTPETGANAGSNWAVKRYSDAGSYLGTPLSISRASGTVNFSQIPTLNGAPMPFLSLAGGALTGPLSVAGNGVSYTGVGPGHALAFGWTGAAIQAFEDGVSVGLLATQAYTTGLLTGYLPLTGGTLSGALTINAVLHGAAAQFSSSVGFANAADFLNFADTSYRYRQWAGNWYDAWRISDGMRVWAGPSAWLMQLDGVGNFQALGSIHANGGRLMSVSSSTLPSVMAWDVPASNAMGFWVDGSDLWLGHSDGAGNPIQGLLAMSVSGAVWVAQSLGVGTSLSVGSTGYFGGYLSVNGAIYTPNVDILSDGISYNSGNAFAFRWTGTTVHAILDGGYDLELISGYDGRVIRLQMIGNLLNWTDSDGSGWWLSPFRSDARYKTNIREAEFFDSLGAICGLPFVEFDWLADMRHVPHGVLASDLRRLLPDAVNRIAESDEEVIDPNTLLVHAMHAIQQLDRKIEELRAELMR